MITSHQLVIILTGALAILLFGVPMVNQYEKNLKMQYQNQLLQEQLEKEKIRFDAYREGNTAN